jgi:hypothetical protein
MKIQRALAGAMLVARALPALADTKYFIVRGGDHRCQAVDGGPVAKDMRIVGPSGMTCRSRDERDEDRQVKVWELSLA